MWMLHQRTWVVVAVVVQLQLYCASIHASILKSASQAVLPNVMCEQTKNVKHSSSSLCAHALLLFALSESLKHCRVVTSTG